MKRLFDLILAGAFILVFLAPMLLIGIAVKITSSGSLLYWSNRVGQRNLIFKMPKFRTMESGAPIIATHLINNPDKYLSPIGKFLRRTSLDELPQLWCILKGDMSFVGPRPALFNQDDLISLRTKNGVDKLIPGLTGWAQVNGRDKLSIPEKVTLDFEYLEKKSFSFDLRIMWMTFLKVINRSGVSH